MANRNLLTATYAAIAKAFRLGIRRIFTTDDGYLGVESDDGINLGVGSSSDLVDRVEEKMVEASINSEGVMEFETDDVLGLAFSMDGEGRLIVTYEDTE